MSFQSQVTVGKNVWLVRYSQPVDISISVRGHVGEFGIEAFGIGQPKATEVCQAYGGIGVNCTSIEFNPHANGTHTECVGHVVDHQRYYVEDCFPGIIQGCCLLVSVTPLQIVGPTPEDIVYSQAQEGDLVVSGKLLEEAILTTLESQLLSKEHCPRILVVRTLPNGPEKYPTSNNSVNWPYFTSDAVKVLDQFDIQHLLVDTPSLDRHPDGGRVEAHKSFWKVSSTGSQNNTTSPRPKYQKGRSLTELCCISDPVKDGIYFIVLSLSPFAFLDAFFSMNFIRHWMSGYHRLLIEKPVQTKSITCGILSFVGDVCAQSIEQKYHNDDHGRPIHIDIFRTLRFTSFGMLIFGPCAHYWYQGLDRIFPKPTTTSLVGKVVMDQTIFTPMAIVTIFSYISTLEGQTTAVLKQKIQQDFWTTLKANWMLWLPAQTINFRLTPPNYRVLFVNGVALIWNIYLASASASPVTKELDPFYHCVPKIVCKYKKSLSMNGQRPNIEMEETSRLLIKGLPKHITEKRLCELFSSQGEVTDVKILKTRSGRSRQFGFIGYKTSEEATIAKHYFHGSFIDTSRLQVEYAKPFGDEQLAPRRKTTQSKEPSLSKKPETRTGEKDGGFQEFLEVMKPRKDKPVWENDWNVDVIGVKTRVAKQEKRSVVSKKPGGQETFYEQLHVRFEEKNSSSDEESYQELEQDNTSPLSTSTHFLSSSLAEESKVTNDVFENYSDNEWLLHKMHLKQLKREVSSEEQDDANNSSLVEEKLNDEPLKTKDVSDSLPTKEESKDDSHEIEESSTKEVNAKPMANVLETGRLFIRNLPYSVTDEELTKLFEKYGLLSDVHVCLDAETHRGKGFAFVTFVIPENAGRAMAELDGSIFQGRLLHILPAMSPIGNDNREKSSSSNSFKEQKFEKLKEAANNTTDRQAWSSLYMSGDAVADAVSQYFHVSKNDVYQNLQDSGMAAVQLAVAEAHIQEEARQALQAAGVNLEALEKSKDEPPSKSVILVKNLSANTSEREINEMFMKFGALRQTIIVPSGVLCLVEFVESNDAKRAYRTLAYSKFKERPLYLEWAPKNIFVNTPSMKPPLDKNTFDHVNIHTGNEVEEKEDMARFGATCIFVKNLDFGTTQDQLRQLFGKIGPLRSVTIAKKKNTKDPSAVPLSMGFGFVEYASEKDAERALNQLQGTILDRHALVLKISERSGGRRNIETATVPRESSSKLLVRNVAFEATTRELRKLFETFGQVKSVRMPRKLDGSHRGFGFVEFLSKQDAVTALQALKDTHFYGRHLVIEFSKSETVESVSPYSEPMKKRQKV
eukprot:jgi/Galph1/4168/GphlegSOOS_G2846.1